MTTKTYYSPASFANSSLIGAQYLTSSVLTIDPEPALIRVSTTYTKTGVSSQGSAQLQVSPDGTSYFQFGDTFFTNVGETMLFDFDAIVSGITKVRMVYQEIGNTGSAGTISAGAMVANDATIEELQLLSSTVYTVPGDMVFADANGNPVALRAGNNGEVLTIASGAPAWAAAGGAALPDLPSDVLLDVSKPNQIVSLNGSGVGTTLTVADANNLLNGRVEYDFSSSAGWTLTNGSGTASITGGKAVLEMPTSTTSGDGGRASITRDLHTLVSPTKFKAAVRLLSITNGDSNTQVGFFINTSAGATNEIRIYVGPTGNVSLGYLGAAWNPLVTQNSAISWDAEHWLEATVVGTNILLRIGSGVAGQYPAQTSNTWRNIWSGNLFSYMQYGRPWDTIGLYLTTYGSGGGAITTELDNVIIEMA